ncbi:MAG: hypothetical protein LBR79_07040 [Oscillospiraceae bacterium]|jgi:hypothetical protein|nr:hypothetical protein [Oscillospiraceae bacterium]
MRIGIMGSENLNISVDKFVPQYASYILTIDGEGINKNVEQYAREHNLPINIFKPDFQKFGQNAELIRNKHLSVQSEMIIIVWDGKSEMLRATIEYAKNIRKRLKVFLIKN